jgi:hypothetical protein
MGCEVKGLVAEEFALHSFRALDGLHEFEIVLGLGGAVLEQVVIFRCIVHFL